MMHIAYEITPDTPQLPTHLSPPIFSLEFPSLPPFATVWLGEGKFPAERALENKSAEFADV